MQRDIRHTPLYKEIEEEYRRWYTPGFGTISAPSDPQVSPDGRTVAFAGTRMEKLEGLPPTRICLLDTESGEIAEITHGANTDRAPRWSPDGSTLAFLSDRKERGQFLPYLLKSEQIGEAISTPDVNGPVESIQWSPDGRSILLLVAGRGAELAGGQGSGKHAAANGDAPAWLPSVDSGIEEHHWRRMHLFDIETNTTRVLSREGLNIWEAAWAGPDSIVAIVSETPDEGAWYSAPLALVDAQTGQERILYRSEWQLGVPASTVDGKRIAVIEACCSDRLVVAGDVLLIDPTNGEVQRPTLPEGDVTVLVWLDTDTLLSGALRGFGTVVSEYNARSGNARVLWTTETNTGIFFPDPAARIAPHPDGGFVLTTDSYVEPPALTLVRNGNARILHSFAHAGTDFMRETGGTMEEVSWQARDGRTIQGLLVRPEGDGPYPLVATIHGGPVALHRNAWAQRRLAGFLAKRGYAVLFPNPRGSSGRGQAFARAVYGDMGGEDTYDYLTGIDALVERGIVDGERVGVTGGSYGGFMTSWLITQTPRFAAAVSVAPVTDQYSFHFTTNIPEFDQLFLQDEPSNRAGKYVDRSPMTFADRVTTPTLNIAGGQDRCTPAGQAEEFHRALLQHGVTSELVIYPLEGHGVRQFPAVIDYTTRAVGWFQRHMPASDAVPSRNVLEEELVATYGG